MNDRVWSKAQVKMRLVWEREPPKDKIQVTGWGDEVQSSRYGLGALTSMEQPSREPRSSALRMI